MRMKRKSMIMWLILLTLLLSQTAFADGGTSMKLWDANVNKDFWRGHPEIKHESVQYISGRVCTEIGRML